MQDLLNPNPPLIFHKYNIGLEEVFYCLTGQYFQEKVKSFSALQVVEMFYRSEVYNGAEINAVIKLTTKAGGDDEKKPY